MTLRLKVGAPITSPNAFKTFSDPVLNENSKFLFDFTRIDSNPHSDGNLSNGAVFTNLVEGAPDAVYTLSSTAAQVVAGRKGVYFPGGASGNFISLGTSYDLYADQPEYIDSLFFKLPASSYTTTNYQQIVMRSDGTANGSQEWIDTGVGGVRPRVAMGWVDGSNSQAVGHSTDITPGGVVQIALRYKPGSPGSFDCYWNGALLASSTSGQITSIRSVTASLRLVGLPKWTVYRFYREYIVSGGRSPAAAIAAEYNSNYASLAAL